MMYALIELRTDYPRGTKMFRKIGQSVHVDLLKEQAEETLRSYGSATSGRSWIEDGGDLIFESRLGAPLYTITDRLSWVRRQIGHASPSL